MDSCREPGLFFGSQVVLAPENLLSLLLLPENTRMTGHCGAQFFINHNNANTTDPRSYFPSTARQLVDHITDSDVTLAILGALRQKRALVDDISTE